MHVLKTSLMKKLFYIIVILFFGVSAFSETKTISEDIIIYKNENISSNGVYCYNYTNTIWNSDFSNTGDWVKLQTSAATWQITNKAPEGVYSKSMGYLKTDFPENEFALFDADNADNTAKADIITSSYIDIENYKSVFVSFVQKYKRFSFDKTFICVSNDGKNWIDIEVNTALNINETAINRIFVDVSSIVSGSKSLLLKFKYTGSNGYAWMIDDVVVKGVMNPMAAIVSLTPNEGYQDQSLNVSLSGQQTNFSQGSQTVWFEQASQTIMYGENILVTSLTEMTFDLNIPLNAPTGMYDVKVENPIDGVITQNNGFEVLPLITPPNWSYTNTGDNHQILIPEFTAITLSGVPIEIGDYIGVFYDSLGTLACGGYLQWQGTTTSMAAWGDNTLTTEKDGFAAGEAFTWKIWDSSTAVEYYAFATYQTSGFPNSDTYVSNGISSLLSLEGIILETQSVSIVSGWSIFSTYIDPISSTCEDIFDPILSNVLIVKDGGGQVYWPAFGVNMIGNITIGEGYQIKLSLNDVLDIQGQAVVPESTPFDIPAGWSIFGYLRQSAADAVSLLSSIVNDIVIVKNSQGNVYWPFWGINDIGNLVPGEGYQIRMLNAVTYTYPANSPFAKTSYVSNYELEHFSKATNTGNNMTLLILDKSWPTEINIGDEIGIFNTNGQIVGSTVYSNKNAAIAIWGKDDLDKDNSTGLEENENFEIRLWNQSTNKEISFSIEAMLEGSDYYIKDGISVVSKLDVLLEDMLYQNSPNPCKNYTNISFSLQNAGYTNLDIYDVNGKLVMHVIGKYLEADSYSIDIDLSLFNSGNYIYKLRTEDGAITKQLQIVR